MSISSTTNAAQFTGNGVTTAFAFPYPFFATSDLSVTLFDTTLNQTVSPAPVLNGAGTYDYTVTGTFNSDIGEYVGGATVTFNTAPPANYRITITRAVPQTQPNSYTNNGPFPAKSVEGSLDRTAILNQQTTAALARAIVAPATDPLTLSMALPASSVRANLFAAFDSQGQIIASAGPASGVPVSVAMQPIVQAATLATAQGLLGTGWAVAGGSADALTVTIPGAALIDGQLIGVRSIAKNLTSTPTITLNGAGGAKTVTKLGGGALSPGDIAGNLAEQFYRYNLANTRWELINPVQTGYDFLLSATASNATSIDFVLSAAMLSQYDQFEVRYTNLLPRTSSVLPLFRVSIDGGASFLAANYNWGAFDANSTPGSGGGGANASGAIQMVNNSLSSGAGLGVTGSVAIGAPAGSANYKFVRALSAYFNGSVGFDAISMAGGRYAGATTAINALRIVMSSGNLDGFASLHGVRKS